MKEVLRRCRFLFLFFDLFEDEQEFIRHVPF